MYKIESIFLNHIVLWYTLSVVDIKQEMLVANEEQAYKKIAHFTTIPKAKLG